jgi:hypothetical protein
MGLLDIFGLGAPKKKKFVPRMARVWAEFWDPTHTVKTQAFFVLAKEQFKTADEAKMNVQTYLRRQNRKLIESKFNPPQSSIEGASGLETIDLRGESFPPVVAPPKKPVKG